MLAKPLHIVYNLTINVFFLLFLIIAELIPEPVYVTSSGVNASYTCIPNRATVATGISWFINETSLNNLQLSDVVEAMDSDTHIGTLTFRNVPIKYNNTRIQCLAITNSDSEIPSNTSKLSQVITYSQQFTMYRYQNWPLLNSKSPQKFNSSDHTFTLNTFTSGPLSAVDSLNASADNTSLLIHWFAPSIVTFTYQNSNITYCVDIVNSSATLHSKCGITRTEFSYLLPPRSWCEEFTVTVTPVNVIGNGTRRHVQFSTARPSK